MKHILALLLMLSLYGFASSPEHQEQESNHGLFFDVMKFSSALVAASLGFFESTNPEITVPFSLLTIVTALFATELEYCASLVLTWFTSLVYRSRDPRFSF